MKFQSNPIIGRFLIIIFLIAGRIQPSFAQEISNIHVGYVGELNRLEVYFDLDAPDNQPYNLNVFLNAFPRGLRKQIPQASIYGLNLTGVKPGFGQYFQIDLKSLKLPAHEYEMEISFQGLKNPKPIRKVDTTSIAKNELAKNNKENKLAMIPKEFSKIQFSLEDFETETKFITVGLNPIDIGGQQSSKTFGIQAGIIKHRIGYALNLKYAISNSPSTNLESNNIEIINYPLNAFYRYNSQIISSRMAIIPSFLFGIKEFLYLRAGIGYGTRNVFWGIDQYDNKWNKTGANWAKNSILSQNGIELETGFNLLIRRFHVAAGINYLGFFKAQDSKAFADAWAGIGINF
jgi:hypothetical protein